MNACGFGNASSAAWNAANSALAGLPSASSSASKPVSPAAIPAWIVSASCPVKVVNASANTPRVGLIAASAPVSAATNASGLGNSPRAALNAAARVTPPSTRAWRRSPTLLISAPSASANCRPSSALMSVNAWTKVLMNAAGFGNASRAASMASASALPLSASAVSTAVNMSTLAVIAAWRTSPRAPVTLVITLATMPSVGLTAASAASKAAANSAGEGKPATAALNAAANAAPPAIRASARACASRFKPRFNAAFSAAWIASPRLTSTLAKASTTALMNACGVGNAAMALSTAWASVLAPSSRPSTTDCRAVLPAPMPAIRVS